jgi:hypothetical protein
LVKENAMPYLKGKATVIMIGAIGFCALCGWAQSQEVAQSSSVGVMPPGQRAQSVFTVSPIPLPLPKTEFPDGGGAPDLPIGQFMGGMGPDMPASPGGQQDAIVGTGLGTFEFFEDNAVATAGFATTDEPSLAAHDEPGQKAMLYTGNWYAAVSGDDGFTYNFISPYTTFPSAVGGFCCDQRAIYEPSRNMFFWLLQYVTSTNGNNIYRIAVANGANGLVHGSWCWYDFRPQDVGLGNGLQFDYPHVALSDNFFYFSANVYLWNDLSGRTGFQDTTIVRIPLDPLTTCSGFTYNFLTLPRNDHYDNNIGHGATDIQYWATILSTSSIRVYRWAEQSGTIFHTDYSVSSWMSGGSPCPDPNMVDWCSARGGVGGIGGTGWINQRMDVEGGRTMGFMWNGAACTNNTQCAYNRPWPYVRAFHFNQTTGGLIDQPDIWNGSYAWAWAGVNVDARGHLGGTTFWGGGANFPNLVAFIWDDFSCNPFSCGWENYWAAGSSASNTNWGDYLDSRPQDPNTNTWVASGFSFDGTNVTPQFVWFGRQRDTPPR